MQKQIQIGALVQGQSPISLGTVKYLVSDPHTSQLTHLVIALDKEQSLKVIAYYEVSDILDYGKTVRLALADEAYLAHLPDFIESNFICAPGPFGRPALPFYQWQNQSKVPLGSTYLYPVVAQSFPGVAERALPERVWRRVGEKREVVVSKEKW